VSEVIGQIRCDAVLVEFLYMFQYTRVCGLLPVFFSAHNVETLKYRRWYEGQPLGLLERCRVCFQYAAIRRLESSVGGRASVVFVTSDYDRDKLREMNNEGEFVVVPNGADPDYFMPRDADTFTGPPSVLFVGSLFYKPNADAVRFLVNEVMPILRSEVAGCECHIVGNTGGGDFSSLHRPESGVFLQGYVQDVRPFLMRSQVLAVPLFIGSGTRIKILEAMASGTPVVSTRVGAEGLDYSAGVDICLAETSAEMAKSISGLIRNPDLAYRMGQAGRRLVENKYSWARSAAIMHAAIDGAMAGRPPHDP
jgi:glycosyltransferase involved in cell wall biosynthesis